MYPGFPNDQKELPLTSKPSSYQIQIEELSKPEVEKFPIGVGYLSPQQAKNNRTISIFSIVYFVLSPMLEQTHFTDNTPTEATLVKERVVGMSRGGDQFKFGPGGRAKTDARRMARNKRSGSISAEGFTPVENYQNHWKFMKTGSDSCHRIKHFLLNPNIKNVM